MMNETNIRIKGVSVPHITYNTRSGLFYSILFYSISVETVMPHDVKDALRGISDRYLGIFGGYFSIRLRKPDRDSYLIEMPGHHIGLRLSPDARLYLPSELPERSLYVLNELMRVFKVTGKLNRTAREDVEEAIAKAESGILSAGVIRAMEDVVGDF